MSAGNPYAMRVLVAHRASENQPSRVELEAPRRVLETPLPGLDRTTYVTGSASRG